MNGWKTGIKTSLAGFVLFTLNYSNSQRSNLKACSSSRASVVLGHLRVFLHQSSVVLIAACRIK